MDEMRYFAVYLSKQAQSDAFFAAGGGTANSIKGEIGMKFGKKRMDSTPIEVQVGNSSTIPLVCWMDMCPCTTVKFKYNVPFEKQYPLWMPQ